MPIHDAGDLVRITASFQASGGAMVDPASVYIEIKNPSGAVTTYGYPTTIVRSDVGAYYIDQLASQTGGWNYRWSGKPSAGLAAAEGGFEIRSSFIL